MPAIGGKNLESVQNCVKILGEPWQNSCCEKIRGFDADFRGLQLCPCGDAGAAPGSYFLDVQSAMFCQRVA